MNYQITVTEEQLKLIESACDLLAKIMTGQSGENTRYLPLIYKCNAWNRELHQNIERLTKPVCVGKLETADTLFDIQEEIRNKLAIKIS